MSCERQRANLSNPGKSHSNDKLTLSDNLGIWRNVAGKMTTKTAYEHKMYSYGIEYISFVDQKGCYLLTKDIKGSHMNEYCSLQELIQNRNVPILQTWADTSTLGTSL